MKYFVSRHSKKFKSTVKFIKDLVFELATNVKQMTLLTGMPILRTHSE